MIKAEPSKVVSEAGCASIALSNPREGWAADAQRIARCGDDALVWPEISNEGDAELAWQ